MQFPLVNQEQYALGFLQFRVPYPKSFGSLAGVLHRGSDIMTPIGVPLYAMVDGFLIQEEDRNKKLQGGKTATLIFANPFKELNVAEIRARHMHLSELNGRTREVKKGELIGWTGNTGTASTAPHLHIDFSTSGSSIMNIDNFIDPEIIFNLTTQYMSQVPAWFKANRTQELMEQISLIKDWKDPMRNVPQYVLAEYLKKAIYPARINVNVFGNLTGTDMKPYKLAVSYVNQVLDGYINLIFQSPQELKEELILSKQAGDSMETLNFNSLQGFNLLITKKVDEITGKQLNGFAVPWQNIAVVEHGELHKQDSKNRCNVNSFAAVLLHELMHVIVYLADFSEPREDKVHEYDYNFTLYNLLPEIAWGLFHDAQFRLNNNL